MSTAIQRLLGIKTPIVLPPLAGVGGGAIAAAVTKGGGFGFIGAGYNGIKTLPAQIKIAREALNIPEGSEAVLPIGVGFITWEVDSIARNPPTPESRWPALDYVIDQKVSALWFSFGEAKPLIDHARSRSPNTKIFVQVQNTKQALSVAKEWKPDFIVVQGSESGGHGAKLGLGMTTFTFLPEVVENFAKNSINIPVLAAGGISNGKQLVAALVMGAEGVCIGTRMIATNEALYNQKQKEFIVATQDGTSTVRTRAYDAQRGTDDWPAEYDGRGIRNATSDMEAQITPENLPSLQAKYKKAVEEVDISTIVTWSGQGVGLVDKILPAAEVVKQIYEEALAATIPKF